MASGKRNSTTNSNRIEVQTDGMEYLSSSSNGMGVWHTLEVMVGQNMRRNLNYEGYNNEPNSSQFNIFTAIRRNDSLEYPSTTTGRKNSTAEMTSRGGKTVTSGSAKNSESGTSVKKHVSIHGRQKKLGKSGKKVCREKYEDLGVDCR